MKKAFIISLIIIVSSSYAWSNLKYKHSSLNSKIFFTPNDTIGRNVVIKGRIESISSSEQFPENDLAGIAREKTKVTVRLYDHQGIKENDRLYIIDSKNHVVSKFNVKYIFKNQTFGYMLIGYGNIALGIKGFRVVQIVQNEDSQHAYIYKSRGDYFIKTGDKGKAISEYKKAIELDSDNPSAHLALGLVYFKDRINNFAYSELKKSYKNIIQLYDNEDKFILLSSLAKVCYDEIYGSYNLESIKENFWNEGIKYCKEALKVNNKSIEINFLLGEFYYNALKQSIEKDKLARDSYLKVTTLYPKHKKANYKLARLYFKHDNKKEGLIYAQKAIDADPANSEARELLRRNQ